MVAAAGHLVDGGPCPAVVGLDRHQIQAAPLERFVRTGEGAAGLDGDAAPVLEAEGATAGQPGHAFAVFAVFAAFAEGRRLAVGTEPVDVIVEPHHWNRVASVAPGPAAVGVDAGA